MINNAILLLFCKGLATHELPKPDMMLTEVYFSQAQHVRAESFLLVSRIERDERVLRHMCQLSEIYTLSIKQFLAK